MCWFRKLGLLHKVRMTCLPDPSKRESNMFARSKVPGLGVDYVQSTWTWWSAKSKVTYA